jgi:hypothetical protein
LNPGWHSQQDISHPGKKSHLANSFFFFSSQKAEDRASIRIEFYDILEPYPVESLHLPQYTEKSSYISPCQQTPTLQA